MRWFFIVLIFVAGCESGSHVGDIPRQDLECAQVEGSAPCCAPPAWDWIAGQCPAGTVYMEGATPAGNHMGACVAAGAASMGDAQIVGPYAQTRDGVAVDYWEGQAAGAELVSCYAQTGRERFVAVWVPELDRSCNVECYDKAGFAVECAGDCAGP